MGANTHTPGPWRIANGKPTKTRGIDVISETANGKFVAHCWFSSLEVYKGEPEARARADARLISAAPDMLVALKHVENYFRSQFDTGTALLVREAIAKAEGRS